MERYQPEFCDKQNRGEDQPEILMMIAEGSPLSTPQLTAETNATSLPRRNMSLGGTMRESKQVRENLKPESFTRKHGDCPDFNESLMSFMSTCNMQGLLQNAATCDRDITVQEQSTEI